MQRSRQSNARRFSLLWLTSIGLSFLLTELTGCNGPFRDFPKIGTVTSAMVKVHSESLAYATMTDAKSLSLLVDFIDERRAGWYTPWYGIPVPVVIVDLYDGNTFKGHFGVGKDFFETQRQGGFFFKDAKPTEVQGFLKLAGVNAPIESLRP